MPRQRLSPPASSEDRTVIARAPDVTMLMGDNQPYLHIIHPRENKDRYAITADGLVIGRGSDADVTLPDAQISRRHCRVRRSKDGIYVEDLGSTNGTQVDGESIDHCVLPPSGRLRVGSFVMRVEYRAPVEIKEERQLIEAAHTDELTGIPNRRQFYRAASTLLAESLTANRPLSFVMIDIDHFKSVNDRFGHAAGDYVIQQVANALRAQIRTSDQLARFGGEEFIMLLPDTSRDDAFIFCDRLCEQISSLGLRYEQRRIPSQVSIGIVTRNAAEFNSIDEAISAADEAMYRAKRQGRNRVSE
ncbi:MAG: GGDEF domain-containing protein [Gammaproteobacteria bacterium]|nr:GGDEF domain-containing protein [Gammaproteobacteria bacterium]